MTPLRRSATAKPSAARRARGARARRSGRAAEVAVAFWMLAKGWRILALRLKTPGTEIDLLARKGRVLAIVEIKARADLNEALSAVSADQRTRLRRAGRQIAARLAARPQARALSVRLDLVALAPGRLPRHIADAWPTDA